jgi:hypothetical protein
MLDGYKWLCFFIGFQSIFEILQFIQAFQDKDTISYFLDYTNILDLARIILLIIYVSIYEKNE